MQGDLLPVSECEETIQVALRFYNAGNYGAAERLCRDALNQGADDSEALHLLGCIACQLGRYRVASRLVEKAISSDPNHAELYNTLGITFEAQGNIDAAIEAYRHAVSLDGSNADAYHNMAIAQQSKGDYKSAIDNCGRAVSIRPEFGQAYNTMGFCQKSIDRLEDALGSFNRAIHFNPNLAEAFNHLGVVLSRQGNNEQAIGHFSRAVEIAPAYSEAYNNLGMAQHTIGRLDHAIESFRTAVLQEDDFAQAHYNLANALKERGDCDQAIVAYHRAIELMPGFAWAHWNLSHALLLSGRFRQGFKEYAWRYNPNLGIVTYPHKINIPRWDGSPFTGKRLLIHYEQGLGDTFQFIRYLPMVKSMGGTVIFESPKELLDLFIGFRGIDELIEATDHETDAEFDYHASLLDLPGFFQTDLHTIPVNVPYLFADSSKSQKWRTKLANTALKVGIVWAGSPDHGRDRDRSCSIKKFLPLTQIEGVQLYSLQKGDAAAQLAKYDSLSLVEDFSGRLHDFSDTAAAIEGLDLIISVDTAVAHLAGAMGKPVWLLLPYSPDWRWMLDRQDSPWYPAMQLFRQPSRGDWTDVFNKVACQLRQESTTVKS